MYSVSITDGISTIILADNNGSKITNWPMNGPEVDSRVLDMLEDGETLSVPRWRNVTDTMDLLIMGSSQADVQAQIEAIERMLDATRYTRKLVMARRVYLQIQLDPDTEVWRSEILAARVTYPNLLGSLYKLAVPVQIHFTRRYYWEGARVELHLSSAATAEQQGGVTVYNADDAVAGQQNYIHVAAARIKGTIPAPVEIKIINASGGNRGTQTVWLSNYVHCTTQTIDPILRGEEANSGASATWSHGNEQDTHRWILPGAMVNAFAGQYVKPLIAFSVTPDSTTMVRGRLELNEGGFPDLIIGEQIQRFTHAIVEASPIPLPPRPMGALAPSLAYLLTMQAADAGGDSVTVDWLQFMPTGWGCYRKIEGIATSVNLDNGEAIVDDGILGETYAVAGGAHWPYYRTYHEPIHLWPNRDNRLRMMIEAGGVLQAGQAWTVQMWYRPRRLML